MSGPYYDSYQTRASSAGATSITPSRTSATGTAQDLYLCVVTTKNNDVHSCATAGWTKLSQVDSGPSFTASLWCANAGSTADPTITWTNSAAASGQIMRFVSPDGVIFAGVGASTSNSGTTSTHSTSAITTTQYDSLLVYIDVSAANTALAAAAGWTELVDNGSATDAGRTVWGSKASDVPGTSSGAISVTGAAAAWVQWQVEIYNVPATALQASQVDVGAWLTPNTGLSASQLDVAAWLTPGTMPAEPFSRRRQSAAFIIT